ncbi:MAG: hypothetical protein JJU06_13450 [Ectothiorhodospiraceae bacterium]|nr:hypothetical protein [Ectothiorhodospiraceae bacterium]MCH8503879.1 hypothetical protein [Ectothiorhodospiraceae bacterium]
MSTRHTAAAAGRLRELLRIRQLRLRAANARLMQPLARLAEMDRQLTAIGDELGQLQQERAAWDRHWQDWLARDGRVYRGQEHNQRHMQLKALEQDIRERRDEINAQRSELMEEIRSLRAEARQRQNAVDQLGELLQEQLRQRQGQLSAIDGRNSEETAATVWRTESSAPGFSSIAGSGGR